MTAKKYTGQDVSGWLMSEKLEGVRVLWDTAPFFMFSIIQIQFRVQNPVVFLILCRSEFYF